LHEYFCGIDSGVSAKTALTKRVATKIYHGSEKLRTKSFIERGSVAAKWAVLGGVRENVSISYILLVIS